MEESLSPQVAMEAEGRDASTAGEPDAGGGVPRWMTIGVIVLILAIVGVGAALVYSVFTVQDVPMTSVDRDITLYKDKVAKSPQDLQAHAALAQAYLAAKRYSEALNEAEKVIKLQPKDLGGYYLKGNALRLVGQYDEALKAYDEVLKLVPTEAEAMYQKAVVYKAKGDLAAAQKSMEGAVEANPMASDFRVELGGLYEQAGLRDRAVEQYQEALKYVPDYAPALQALERLGAGAQ